MHTRTLFTLIVLLLLFGSACESEKQSIRKYRNGNYEWLLDFFKKEEVVCDPSNGKVLLNKQFGELEVDDKHASSTNDGKYELLLNETSRLLDQDGFFRFYIAEFRDSSFLLEYSSEHRYPSKTEENTVEIHQDKGRIRCRCDVIL
ncbi:MAG: hypothetical protein AAFO94_10810 [Bacteroidota bacterium]